LGLVGARDFTEHAWSGVTARLRPGSTLKPFVYATAIEQGDTPATIAEDIVLPEDAHQFYAKDVRAHGFARYRESLAGSYNLSAVHTLQRVGVDTVLRKLRTAGLTTLDRPDDEYDWGLAIGPADVPLLRAAYTAIAARFGDPTAPARPDGVVAATICPVSGKRPGPHCDHGKRELFLAGHVPEETCDWHQLVCGERTIVYPESLRGWA